ncbi:MAG TPA: cobyric acid synthase [Methylibium sp.]|nr:cobyric acid synthase [Methylibium sp.]
MSARAVMVLGCTSGAGKSWLATALCRWYARQGLRVAPFKAQNMSNHARVALRSDGSAGEIGSAQHFQALAARVRPDVRMNPVLLKPESDRRSQVVLMGEARPELAALPWRERSTLLWPTAQAALASLRDAFDVVVIEGAGSPAEINLAASDYVNTRTARASEAACLLLADIDRGGAFAHLFGTHALMDAGVRAQLRGFVLNKFRGDPALLAPAPQQLEALTGVPTLATLPMWREHGLPEEDAVPADTEGRTGPRVVVLAYPHASNLDEFEPLREAGVALHFSRERRTLADADWLLLPGSKHTRADLAWLREQGLDALVQAHAASGRPLLAVCGGLQMLGEQVDDDDGIEGGVPGRSAGLGLLPLATRLAPAKRLGRTPACFATLDGPWAALSGLAVEGYEIHSGRSASRDAGLRVALGGAAPLGWQRGNVLALYLHGLFENPALVRALFGAAALRTPDAVFDGLADLLDAHFAPGALQALLEPAPARHAGRARSAADSAPLSP